MGSLNINQFLSNNLRKNYTSTPKIMTRKSGEISGGWSEQLWGEPQCGEGSKILEFIPSQKGCYFTTVLDGANLAKYPIECKHELLTKQT